MSLTVRLEEKPDATVVRLGGAVDPDVLAMVGDGLRTVSGDGRAIVLAIDELTILDPQALARLVHSIQATDPHNPGSVRVACGRISARRLIERGLRDDPLPLFPSVDAALAAYRRRVEAPAAPAGA